MKTKQTFTGRYGTIIFLFLVASIIILACTQGINTISKYANAQKAYYQAQFQLYNFTNYHCQQSCDFVNMTLYMVNYAECHCINKDGKIEVIGLIK